MGEIIWTSAIVWVAFHNVISALFYIVHNTKTSLFLLKHILVYKNM